MADEKTPEEIKAEQEALEAAKERADVQETLLETTDELTKRAQALLELDKQRLKEAEKTAETKLSIARSEGEILETARLANDIERQRLQFEINKGISLESNGKLEEDELALKQQILQSMQAREEILSNVLGLTEKVRAKTSSFAQEEIANIKGLTQLAKQLGDASAEPLGFFKGMRNQLAGLDTMNVAIGGISKMFLTIGKTSLDQTIKQAFALDKVNAAFTAQTGIVGPLRDQIGTLYQQNLELGMSMEDVSKSTSALAGGFTEFVALNPSVQRAVTEQTALLEKIGVSSATSAKMMNELTKSMGMTTGEAMATTRSITSLGIQLGIPGDVINQKFVAALPKLRVYGDRAVEVFRDLTIAARETGTSVESLIGTFGDSMNTFEGSAQVAGKLNAVLGTDMFSSTELLMATEAERVQIMKERIAMSGVDFANLSKYQQIALANAAGFNDVNEAAKVFGNTQSQVGMQIGSLTMTTAELEERSQKARSVQDKLKFAIQSFAVALEPLVGLLAKAGNGLVSFTEFMTRSAETTKGKFIKGFVMAGLLIVGFILLLMKFRKGTDKATKSTEAQAEATESLTEKLKDNLKVKALSILSNVAEAKSIDRVTAALRRRGAAGLGAGVRGGAARTAATTAAAAGTGAAATAARTATTAAGAVAPTVAREGAEQAAKRGGLRLGAAAIKSGIKKIPFLGALMGIGLGAQRAMGGDLVGAGMEVASGLASSFPGLGTGASLAIDAGLMARDVRGASREAPDPASAAVGGITTREGLVNVHPQEAIVPLDQLMSKFDQLISAVGSPGSGGGEMVVKVMLNERELGEAVVPLIDRRVLGEV